MINFISLKKYYISTANFVTNLNFNRIYSKQPVITYTQKTTIMKITSRKVNYLLLLVLSTFLISCSGDDDSGNGGGTPINYSNFMPLTVADNWTYDVSTNDGTNTTPSTDVITVDGTVMLSGKEYSDMSMSQGSTGIMSSMLDQNNFRYESGVYYMKGDFVLPLSQLGGTDLTINIDDAQLINENSNNGATLTSQPGTTSQTIQGYDLDINYTLKTVQRETLASHTVNGTTYNNVIVADIIVTASVTTMISPIPTPVTLLPSQDIYTIKNYYADNVGLVDSDATFTYNLANINIPGVTLPIPDTATVTTTQEINSYTVATANN